MNMVGHDHPGSELIKIPSTLAVQESIGYHIRYSGILQPDRSESSFVHFTVQDEEARPADRVAPVCGCGSLARGMEPAKRQVTNRKVASVRSGCQWGSVLR